VPEATPGRIVAPWSIDMITRPTASMPVKASFAPVATRSMTPLTWPRLPWTTRTTKLTRLIWPMLLIIS
jgi:hypothetical protein